jgi:hypothetical protein
VGSGPERKINFFTHTKKWSRLADKKKTGPVFKGHVGSAYERKIDNKISFCKNLLKFTIFFRRFNKAGTLHSVLDCL